MDINRLLLLCDIAETKNLTMSAERLGYTQSGVSHAINKLESELGVSLLKRTNRGVELTRDGELLLPKIRMVVTHSMRLQETIDSVHGLQRGSICIGTYSSVASRWLPPILHRFQQLYPNISIRLKEGGLEEIEQWMNDGSVDFGFLSWRDGQGFKFISLARDPLYAVTSLQYELPEEYHGVFPMTAFNEHSFIASEFGVDMDVTLALQIARIKPCVSFYCRDDHTIISMVENGLGVSLLPALFIEGTEDRIQKFQTDPCYVRTLGIGIVSEKNLSVAAKAFIKLAREMVSKMKFDPPCGC